METPAANPGTIKALLIMHKAMLSGQLIFGVFAFYLVYTRSFTQSLRSPEILQVVAIAVLAAGLYTGHLLFKKKLLPAREMLMSPKEN